MSLARFQSESYPSDQRDAAWQDFLETVGFIDVWNPGSLPASLGNYCSGIAYASPPELVFVRLSATGRELAPVARRGIAPMIVLPLDEAIEIGCGDEGGVLRSGEFGLVPSGPGWHIRFARNSRTICVTLPESMLAGRRSENTRLTSLKIFHNQGIAGIFAGTIETIAAEMERLQASDWPTIAQQLTHLFFGLNDEDVVGGAARLAGGGLLGRVSQTIETHLGEGDLSAETVARMEGISERYLQRLFKQKGETFSHYLRERRLQRARTMLSVPGDADVSVANVAYSCGFSDAANFNRIFKQRFGQPPGAYRAELSSLRKSTSEPVENRGWPIAALSRFRPRNFQPRAVTRPDIRVPSGPDTLPGRLHHLKVGAQSVHWGYFSRSLTPVLSVRPGDQIIVETLTQHASDAPELMIEGDPAAEEVFFWDGERKGVDRRGAGPTDASVFGRGAGEGFGVHICTGPIFIEGAEPGDVVEVHIDDISPRQSCAPGFEGRIFGSTVSAWWGYQYQDLLSPPNPRETVTIYEIHHDIDGSGHAEMLYSFHWKPQTDPFGVVHPTYDYPGIPVQRNSVELEPPPELPLQVPLRPHFGVIALAPREEHLIDSVPPAYFGGNIDNWRLGKGASVFLPVSVRGALLSIGDPHAAQGDGELAGTAIECSMTGRVTVRLHKRGTPVSDISYPLIETPEAWVLTGFSHPDYLAEFGAKGQSEVYAKSSLDLAMRDAFRKARRFLMARFGLTEDQAIAHVSAAVDFGVTQVVDGNLGIHAIIPKSLLSHYKE